MEPKTALGAKPEPVNIWLRQLQHRVPVLNRPASAVLDAVPHAEAPERGQVTVGVILCWNSR